MIIHEQDLRGALGVPGGQDSGGVAAVRDRFLPRFGARVADLPPIALVGDGFVVGVRGRPGRRRRRGPRVRLRPRPRARHAPVGGQLRSWTMRGDVGPYLDGFALLGALPATDLAE